MREAEGRGALGGGGGGGTVLNIWEQGRVEKGDTTPPHALWLF